MTFDEIIERLVVAHDGGDPHTLLYDAFGGEKDAVARALAGNRDFVAIRGYDIRRLGDLNAILSSIDPDTVVLIDDIERLPTVAHEALAAAMTTRQLRVVIGQGPAARELSVELPRFLIVGATSRPRKIARPLREAFSVHVDCVLPRAETTDAMLERERNELRMRRAKNR